MWARLLMRLMRLALRVGYRPAPPAPAPLPDWIVGGELLAGARSVICLPTYLARCALDEHVAAVARASEQAAGMAREAGCVLLVAFQYGPGQAREAEARLRAIGAALPQAARARTGLALIGTLGKVTALNACIAALRQAGAPLRHFGWLDDDIRFNPDTFERLRAHLESHSACDMAGARKIPVANHQKAASLLKRMKQVAKTTSVPHPHGCGVLLRWRAIADGIPGQFTSDDGYLAMHLFDEARGAHYRRMAIVQDACCWHTVGGSTPEIWKRVHRTIYENILLLAHFPVPKSALFFRSAIAHGLTPFPRSATAALNVVLKLLLIGLYLRACAVLLLAGLFGRPMRDVQWSPYSGLNVPGETP
jgi:hypothetical protein